jgi:hypothetical protein
MLINVRLILFSLSFTLFLYKKNILPIYNRVNVKIDP